MAKPAFISRPKCDGTGRFLHSWYHGKRRVHECERCNGTGRIPLTEHHEEAE